MNEYTPDTEEVRSRYKGGAWLKGREGVEPFNPDEYEPIYFGEFDRWLAEVERAAAEKLEAELVARIEDRDYWYKIATEAKDQRDAALSTIAKVREILVRDELDGWEHDEWVYRQESDRKLSEIEAALGSVPSTGEGNG